MTACLDQLPAAVAPLTPKGLVDYLGARFGGESEGGPNDEDHIIRFESDDSRPDGKSFRDAFYRFCQDSSFGVVNFGGKETPDVVSLGATVDDAHGVVSIVATGYHAVIKLNIRRVIARSKVLA